MNKAQRAAPLLAWIEGIGVRGPGLGGWAAARELLAGREAYAAGPTVLVPPPLLPPAERRRVGKGVKVALEVGFEAAAHSGRDPATLASVFASSSGDGDNCDAICRALASDRLISPTRFHNSVHNAPSGYWGIAAQSHAPSTSLCAFDASFAAGLMDAMTQLACGTEAVLLVSYDAPYPEPLLTARPTPDAFGVALVLARDPGARAIACIEIAACEAGPITQMTPGPGGDEVGLEACRAAIPAARALPLLRAIASATSRTVPRTTHAAVDAVDHASNRTIVIEDVNDTRLALTVRGIDALRIAPIVEPARCA